MTMRPHMRSTSARYRVIAAPLDSVCGPSVTVADPQANATISSTRPHVPRFDTMVAIHRPRKRPFFSGLHAVVTIDAASVDACGRLVLTSWRRSGFSERCEILVNECDHGGAFADSGPHALDGAEADITYGEDAAYARFE